MDELITKASNQAMSFAIRSGISLASGFAIKTAAKLMETEKVPVKEKNQINEKISRIKISINVVTPAIELIRSVNAQYNSLNGCNELIDQLTQKFTEFDQTIEEVPTGQVVKQLNQKLDSLIEMIDRTVPLLNLCISSSNLINKNMNSISINKLIEASSYVTRDPTSTKVGPSFDLKYFSMFYNENNPESPIIWKENFARSEVTFTSSGSYDYSLTITENFDDGRYHEDDPQVVTIKLSEIQKLFFTKSGKLLKLDDNSPVFIIKFGDKYIAFGSYVEGSDTSEESEESDTDEVNEKEKQPKVKKEVSQSLSLLEYLIRLLVLQANEKKHISSITDEKILLYLKNDIPQHQDHDLTSNIKRLENLKI